MITFLHPNMLYHMILVIILFALLLTQKESHADFFSSKVMDKLRVSANSLSLRVRNVLFFLMAILLVVAMANPVIKEGKVEVKAKSADIMIALDISDSMLAKDIYPNRLNAAKEKAMELLKLAPNERIGVIAFAKNSYLVSPLSFDHNAVGFLLRNLDTSSITEKGTNLLSMLEVVDRSIKKESQKYLLILSDGGDKSDFSKEIAFAKEKKITIFVLGEATPKGAPIQQKNGRFIKENGKIIISKLNENIANLATKTGGVYIQSVLADKDIKTMLQEIEKHSTKSELKSEEVERFEPLFYYSLGMAILLLLIATSSLYKRSVPLIAIVVLMQGAFVQDAEAGLLDFLEVNKAQTAYDKGNFKESARSYDSFADKTQNNESHYNAGNAFYKENKYKEALKSYEKASFSDKAKEAQKYSNIGNAYVKQQKKALLQKAVEAYEKSLKLKEDKETRENLEAVKKALQQQKKQKKKKKNSQDKKDNKKQKNKQDKKDKKKSDKKKDSKDSQNSKNSDKNSKDTKENEKPHEKSAQQKKKEHEAQKKKEKQEQKKAKEKQQKKQKEQLKELDKEKKEKQEKGEKSQASKMQKSVKMSNEEEKKWLKRLNQQQNSYMYRLNNENQKEEDSNEKPW